MLSLKPYKPQDAEKQLSLIKHTDRIYSFPMSKINDRPFLYYIRGEKFSVAVDAGQSPLHVEQFYNSLKENNFPLPEYTVLTHWHWDHSFGIPYVNGKTIGSELSKQQLDIVKTWEWTEDAMKQRELSGEDLEMINNDIRAVYPDLNTVKVENVDIAISEKMELDLGDIHLELYPRDSIHSRDALLIYCPEEKALFVGDADCKDCYNNWEVLPERVENYRAFINSLDFDNYYIGHDNPDTKEGVNKYLDDLLNGN